MIIRRLFGRRRTRRVAEIAAKHWNATVATDFESRARVAKARTEEELGSVFTSLLLSIAVKIAIKMIEKWAEENLFNACQEDIDKWAN